MIGIKWINHKLLTGMIVYVATDSVVFAMSAAAGSIIPDLLEGKPPEYRDRGKQYYKWLKKHRQISHWSVPYLCIGIFLNMIQHKYDLTLYCWSWSYVSIGIFFFIGCILHILEDSICGKVPLFMNPKKKYGIKLFIVGSAMEYIFVYFVIFALIIVGQVNE